jgi:hypothetical protein
MKQSTNGWTISTHAKLDHPKFLIPATVHTDRSNTVRSSKWHILWNAVDMQTITNTETIMYALQSAGWAEIVIFDRKIKCASPVETTKYLESNKTHMSHSHCYYCPDKLIYNLKGRFSRNSRYTRTASLKDKTAYELKRSPVQVVVLAACEPRGHRLEQWPLHIAQCVHIAHCGNDLPLITSPDPAQCGGLRHWIRPLRPFACYRVSCNMS